MMSLDYIRLITAITLVPLITLLANLSLYSYESDFIADLSKGTNTI